MLCAKDIKKLDLVIIKIIPLLVYNLKIIKIYYAIYNYFCLLEVVIEN